METPNFGPWVTDDDIEAQLQDNFTRGTPLACALEHQCMESIDTQCAGKFRQALIRLFLIRAAGKSYGDPSAELWSMYLSKNETPCREIREEWLEDRNDVLLFVSLGVTSSFFLFKLLVQTSLFSATVAIFLMESYKLLSPDLSIAIVASLTQIPQQLVSISNGTSYQNFIVQIDVPFKPTASAIRINVMWLFSLILSLTYSLSAARPYWGFAQYHRAQDKHTHILRDVVVDSRSTLIRLSIFLFIAGLVDFLLMINKTVAFCVICYVMAFSFAYFIFTESPSLCFAPPYRDLPGKCP